MNLDVNQQKTYITTRDDSAMVVRETILPPGQPKFVIPGPTDDAAGIPPSCRPTAAHRGKIYGMSLAWRGLRVLGVAFGIAVIWFAGSWVRHGRMPLELGQPRIRASIESPPVPILPPVWLLAILGLFVLISISMMLFGTQDVAPKIRFTKAGEPDYTPRQRQPRWMKEKN